MVDFSTLPPGVVFGSLVTATGPRPFVFEPESTHLTLDDFVAWSKPLELTDERQREIEALIRLASELPFREIRFAEYQCPVCHKWMRADRGQWSVAMCFSCSMDRDSDHWG